jgi:hypothetical protein
VTSVERVMVVDELEVEKLGPWRIDLVDGFEV